MTNIEKAKELAEDNEKSYIMYDGETETTSYNECYQTAMEMADWKDQQFAEEKKQLIDKAAKWLEDNQRAYKEYDESGFYHERSQNLIKDFKQAMEE